MCRITVLFVFVAGLSFGKLDNSLVWKFFKKGTQDTSYVYGTMHIPHKKSIATVDTVMQLMDRVDIAGFELVMTTEQMLAAYQMMMVKDSTEQLQNLLSAEEFAFVDSCTKKNKIIRAMGINNVKPFAILSALSSDFYLADTTMAMDMLFQKEAKTRGVKYIGIESLEEQMAAIDRTPLKQQAKALYEFLKVSDEQEKQMTDLIDAYCAMDGTRIVKLMSHSLEASLFFDEKEMLDNRNKTMVQRIDSIHQKSTLLVGVGAGHLFGKKGVLSLLEKKGYKLLPVLKAEQRVVLKEE